MFLLCILSSSYIQDIYPPTPMYGKDSVSLCGLPVYLIISLAVLEKLFSFYDLFSPFGVVSILLRKIPLISFWGRAESDHLGYKRLRILFSV